MTNTNQTIIELTVAYSRVEAERVIDSLTAATGDCYMEFTFCANPIGGGLSISAMSTHEDAASEGRDMLLMILTAALTQPA